MPGILEETPESQQKRQKPAEPDEPQKPADEADGVTKEMKAALRFFIDYLISKDCEEFLDLEKSKAVDLGQDTWLHIPLLGMLRLLWDECEEIGWNTCIQDDWQPFKSFHGTLVHGAAGILKARALGAGPRQTQLHTSARGVFHAAYDVAEGYARPGLVNGKLFQVSVTSLFCICCFHCLPT